MKIATWNVNSIRAREERLLSWLERHAPDVLCLQELKVHDEAFPFEKLKAAGYHAAINAQKTYNGVAILSKAAPADVSRGLCDGEDDTQARLVAARISGIRFVSVYVPNGQSVGSDKWHFKMAWLGRLRAWLDRCADPAEPLVLCGDFNVAPDARDVANPEKWEPTVLFHPDARRALEAVVSWGLVDTFRLHHDEGGFYSWWDYRMLGFPKNDGLRIDHLYVTRPLVARCTGASIDREERKGQRPSDHVPVVAELS
jgi:exodeoxyribonuclease III